MLVGDENMQYVPETITYVHLAVEWIERSHVSMYIVASECKMSQMSSEDGLSACAAL